MEGNDKELAKASVAVVPGDRFVVVSGDYGIGRHGTLKWKYNAGETQGGLFVMDDGWSLDGSGIVWYPLYCMRRISFAMRSQKKK